MSEIPTPLATGDPVKPPGNHTTRDAAAAPCCQAQESTLCQPSGTSPPLHPRPQSLPSACLCAGVRLSRGGGGGGAAGSGGRPPRRQRGPGPRHRSPGGGSQMRRIVTVSFHRSTFETGRQALQRAFEDGVSTCSIILSSSCSAVPNMSF